MYLHDFVVQFPMGEWSIGPMVLFDRLNEKYDNLPLDGIVPYDITTWERYVFRKHELAIISSKVEV